MTLPRPSRPRDSNPREDDEPDPSPGHGAKTSTPSGTQVARVDAAQSHTTLRVSGVTGDVPDDRKPVIVGLDGAWKGE